MSPFYFGDSARPLFGIYSPANPARDRQKALLVCPPIFQDYMRSHRTLKNLAVDLSGRGIHVLRFDYYGCGDSAGSWEDSSIEEWVSNIELAAEELQAMSMVDNLSFLGVRLGATLLANAKLENFPSKKIALWDPILDGKKYLETLVNLQMDLVEDNNRFKLSRKSYLDEHDMELIGYPISAEAKAQLANLSLQNIALEDRKSTLIHSHHESAYQSFVKNHNGIELRSLSLPCNWDTLQHLDSQVQAPELASLVNDLIA